MEPAVLSRRRGRGRADAACAGAAAAGRGGRGHLPHRPGVGAEIPRGDRRQGPRQPERAGGGATAAAARRLAGHDARGAAGRRAHALRTAARALPGDARHRGRRSRRGRRSGEQRRGDPHARARSAALAVPATAGLEDRARPLSADDERAGAHGEGSPISARAWPRPRPRRRAATIASSSRCRTAWRWASCGSTTTAARRRTPSS